MQIEKTLASVLCQTIYIFLFCYHHLHRFTIYTKIYAFEMQHWFMTKLKLNIINENINTFARIRFFAAQHKKVITFWIVSFFLFYFGFFAHKIFIAMINVLLHCIFLSLNFSYISPFVVFYSFCFSEFFSFNLK